MMALDDNLPSEENELPADIDDFLKAGYARFLEQQNYEPIKIRHISIPIKCKHIDTPHHKRNTEILMRTKIFKHKNRVSEL